MNNDAIVREYDQLMLIGMHCRNCRTQVGFFDDIDRINNRWIIFDYNLFNIVETRQKIFCENCHSGIAYRYSEMDIELHRSAILLCHFS